MGGGRREKWGHIHIHFLSSLIYISLKIKQKNHLNSKGVRASWPPPKIWIVWTKCKQSTAEKPGQGLHGELGMACSRVCEVEPSWILASTTVPLVSLEPPGLWPCHCLPMNQSRAPKGARLSRCPGHSAVIHWGVLQSGAQGCSTWVMSCRQQKE